LSKRRSGSRVAVRTRPPGHDLHIQTNQPAAQATFVWEQAAFFCAKDFGEKLNLFVGHNATLSFDVGEDVAGHITPKQLQFPHKLVLRPTALITKLCDVLANNIFIAVHTHLQELWAGLHSGEQQERPGDLNQPVLLMVGVLVVGMLLERWWFRIRLGPGRIAQRENHNRNFMHRAFAAAHNNPSNDEETKKGKPNEKIFPMLLNQTIQELGHMRDINNRVFHIILRRLSDSLQPLVIFIEQVPC
jgi:hypothetical protein